MSHSFPDYNHINTRVLGEIDDELDDIEEEATRDLHDSPIDSSMFGYADGRLEVVRKIRSIIENAKL